MSKSLAFPVVALLFAGTFPVTASATLLERGEQRATAAVRPAIRVAAADNATVIQSLAGEPGKPLPLAIAPPAGGSQDFRFVMVRGLPETVSITAGFRVRQSWFIAIKDIDGVQLLSPDNFRGNFMLEFFYFRDSQEAPLATAAVNVRLGSGAGDSPTLTATVPPQVEQPAAKPKRPRPVAFSAEQEAEMLLKGDEYLNMGDVASARLLFEDLAAHGSAKGTLAMGRTYDPNFLKEAWVAGGLQPNMDKAKLWYQRAADMGSNDAQKRLSVLGAK